MGSVVSSTGCGGSGGAGGSGGGGGTGGSGGSEVGACFDYSQFDGTTPAVSFKTDVLPIFQLSCGASASCHGDPGAPFDNRPFFGLKKGDPMTDDQIASIFKGIVGVSSFYEPGMSIVKAGDAENSFLMYKLDDQLTCEKLECSMTKDCGVRMPQANATLGETERDTVRRWITQGALNN